MKSEKYLVKKKHSKKKSEPKKEKSLEDSIFGGGEKYLSTNVDAPGLSSLDMDFDA